MSAALVALAGALTVVSPPQAWAADGAYKSLKGAHNPEWMKGIGDDTPFGWLSIPGTHESMAIHNNDWAVTQENFGDSAKTLAAQLDAGIRSIDIRVRVIDGAFTIHHGAFYQHANFADVLKVLGQFLAAHPSETVGMHLRAECDNNSAASPVNCNDDPKTTTDADRVDIFRKYLDQDPNGKFFWGPSVSGKGQPAAPKLGDVRGKIVLERFRNVDASGSEFGLPAGNFSIQDAWNVPTVFDIPEKKQAIREQFAKLEGPTADNDPTHIYLNYLSGSGWGAQPWTVARATNPAALADIEDGVRTEGMRRTGEVMMDFPGYQLINDIIAANKPYVNADR